MVVFIRLKYVNVTLFAVVGCIFMGGTEKCLSIIQMDIRICIMRTTVTHAHLVAKTDTNNRHINLPEECK